MVRPFHAPLSPPTRRDGLILDITGAAHLFGGEAAMLDHGDARKSPPRALPCRPPSPAPPWRRGRWRDSPPAISRRPARKREALARLPVAALECGRKDHRARCSRAGLKTIAQVAERGRDELAARFGKAFVTALEILLGRHDKPLNPRRPLPDLMAEQRFAEPVVTEDAIAASLLSLAQSLERGAGTARAGPAPAGSRLSSAPMARCGASRCGWAAPRAMPTGCCGCCSEKLDALHDPLDPGFGFDLIRLEAMLTERTRSVDSQFRQQ